MDFGAPGSHRRRTLVWTSSACCLALLVVPTLVVGLVTGSFITAMFTGLGVSVMFLVAAGVLAQIAGRVQRRERTAGSSR
jgi:undecaprenyl pyrophosphate phosphatase UppP